LLCILCEKNWSDKFFFFTFLTVKNKLFDNDLLHKNKFLWINGLKKNQTNDKNKYIESVKINCS